MTEHFLTSEMLRLACPSVIVLNQFCKVPRLHDKKQAPRYPSRVAILMRDDSTCQYCSAVATTVAGDDLWGFAAPAGWLFSPFPSSSIVLRAIPCS